MVGRASSPVVRVIEGTGGDAHPTFHGSFAAFPRHFKRRRFIGVRQLAAASALKACYFLHIAAWRLLAPSSWLLEGGSRAIQDQRLFRRCNFMHNVNSGTMNVER